MYVSLNGICFSRAWLYVITFISGHEKRWFIVWITLKRSWLKPSHDNALIGLDHQGLYIGLRSLRSAWRLLSLIPTILAADRTVAPAQSITSPHSNVKNAGTVLALTLINNSLRFYRQRNSSTTLDDDGPRDPTTRAPYAITCVMAFSGAVWPMQLREQMRSLYKRVTRWRISNYNRNCSTSVISKHDNFSAITTQWHERYKQA